MNQGTATLKKLAQQKKIFARSQTQKAIAKLKKSGDEITIAAVAREANVSRAYIYQQKDLTSQIQKLRDQQKALPVKDSVVTQLRDRIKLLEEENQELQKKLNRKVVDNVELENIRLNQENDELRQQLDFVRRELSRSREFILKRKNN